MEIQPSAVRGPRRRMGRVERMAPRRPGYTVELGPAPGAFFRGAGRGSGIDSTIAARFRREIAEARDCAALRTGLWKTSKIYGELWRR